MSGIIGRIYKITSNETDYIYIGSTTQQLNVRFVGHKTKYKTYTKNNHEYITSFELCKYVDAKIELIHEGLFSDRKDMEKYEGDTIRTTPNAINKIVPGTTKQESAKKYYEQNKEAISERRKQYYEKNKEQSKQYTNQYIEQHREKINEQKRQNYKQKKS